MAQCWKCLKHHVHLWEVAGGWGAVAEGVLGWQRVVKGRPAHMAGAHILLLDIKLLAQTDLQLVSAACELEGANAQKNLWGPTSCWIPVRYLLPVRILTMLMKAERKTSTMIMTPTRVLLSLDWTILLDRCCRGTGKSCQREQRSGACHRFIDILFQHVH